MKHFLFKKIDKDLISLHYILILFVCHYQSNLLFGSTRERRLDHRNY